MTGLILLSHTTIGVTIFAFHEHRCNNNTVTVHILNLNEEIIKSTYQRYYRFSQLLFSFLSILHWFEYAYLFYGIFRFLYTTNKVKDESSQNDLGYNCIPLILSYKSGIAWERKPNPCAAQKKFLKTKLQSVITVFFVLFFLGCSVTPPITSMIRASRNIGKNDNCLYKHVVINFTYHTLTIAARIIAVLVRVIFILAAAICGTIWLKQPPKENRGSSPQTSATCSCSKDRQAAVNRFYKIMIDYEERKELVKPIYKIFRSWFVFQWVHYTFELSHDLVYLLRPWIWDETTSVINLDMFLIQHLSICLYDVLAILTSYLPALKMNAYMRRYVHRQQNQQKKNAKKTGSEAQYAYALAEFKIQPIQKSSFIPRVPGFGINISLDGPGFVLATVILITGSVATFSKF